MTIEEALRRINNLDVREPLRKYSPQWATVVVESSGQILDVIPHKEAPSLELHRQHMERYPKSLQFTTWQGQFSTPDTLAAKINENVRMAKIAARPENKGKRWIKSILRQKQ